MGLSIRTNTGHYVIGATKVLNQPTLKEMFPLIHVLQKFQQHVVYCSKHMTKISNTYRLLLYSIRAIVVIPSTLHYVTFLASWLLGWKAKCSTLSKYVHSFKDIRNFADPTRLSKRKKQECVEPFYNRYKEPKVWRISRQIVRK